MNTALDEECRLKFLGYCNLYARADSPELREKYWDSIWRHVDIYLDWCDIDRL